MMNPSTKQNQNQTIPRQRGPLLVRQQPRRVWPVRPVQDDLRVGRAGAHEGLVVVGGVQVAPDAGVGGRDVEPMGRRKKACFVALKFNQAFEKKPYRMCPR